jgi:hypothetical protein
VIWWFERISLKINKILNFMILFLSDLKRIIRDLNFSIWEVRNNLEKYNHIEFFKNNLHLNKFIL